MTGLESSVSMGARGAERWCEDPLGRYELRWWDGAAWTAQVQSGGRLESDPLGTAASPEPGDQTAETWQTRPETVWAFLGNLLLCTLFPFFALWYGPKYVMRHEYLKAFVCVAVPLVLLGAFVLV